MSLTKRSSFTLAGLGLAGLVHGAQNALMRFAMQHPEKTGNVIPKIMMHGLVNPGKSMPSLGDTAVHGFAKGLVPELHILHQEMSHAGQNLRKELGKVGIDPDNLSMRQKVVFRKLLQGDVLGAMRLRTPEGTKIVTSYLNSLMPEKGVDFSNFLSKYKNTMAQQAALRKELGEEAYSSLKRKAFIALQDMDLKHGSYKPLSFRDKYSLLDRNLQHGIINQNVHSAAKAHLQRQQAITLAALLNKAIQNNDLLGGMSRVAKNKQLLRDIHNWASQGAGNSEKGKNIFETAMEIAGEGAMGALDPLAMGMNVGKRLASHPSLGKTTIGKAIQDKSADIFVKKPVTNEFIKGLHGNETNTAFKMFNSYGKNALTGTAQELANTVGTALNQSGYVPGAEKQLARDNFMPIISKGVRPTMLYGPKYIAG